MVKNTKEKNIGSEAFQEARGVRVQFKTGWIGGLPGRVTLDIILILAHIQSLLTLPGSPGTKPLSQALPSHSPCVPSAWGSQEAGSAQPHHCVCIHSTFTEHLLCVRTGGHHPFSRGNQPDRNACPCVACSPGQEEGVQGDRAPHEEMQRCIL